MVTSPDTIAATTAGPTKSLSVISTSVTSERTDRFVTVLCQPFVAPGLSAIENLLTFGIHKKPRRPQPFFGECLRKLDLDLSIFNFTEFPQFKWRGGVL